ncbi:hypothetical protein V1638_03535 [Pseudarthrobacter sp. J64]|uniref:hypothetical protein n=1 Tax=Pseudarthrobacter sp. J64 TaxID=3116485 RepID=UPI002E80DD70|nr:hypothetical protein [Pseudarthrobacter sp. J64]MEE2568471.1 hypothetical protein [Pseudarthrobacter sp. J64]
MPSDPRAWSSDRGGQSRRRTIRQFALFALGSLGTFFMAVRAVAWLDGPVWLGLTFVGIGLVLAAYYLVRLFRAGR